MAEIPQSLPVLESERIRLRPLRMDDAAEVFTMFSDARVTRYWSFQAWTEPAQAEAWLAERIGWGPPSVYGWAMADRASDAFIGTTALFSLSGPLHRAELGYSLMPARQGEGLATEAVRRALDFGFDVLGLERIEADVDPRNLASCRLAERLGFQREGLLRNRWRVGGEFADSILYGLLRGEYRRAP